MFGWQQYQLCYLDTTMVQNFEYHSNTVSTNLFNICIIKLPETTLNIKTKILVNKLKNNK